MLRAISASFAALFLCTTSAYSIRSFAAEWKSAEDVDCAAFIDQVNFDSAGQPISIPSTPPGWSEFCIGSMYSFGIHVPEDAHMALDWFRKSAAENFGPAEYNIGYYYQVGKAVPVDFEQARLWYERAASHQFNSALYHLSFYTHSGWGYRAITRRLHSTCLLLRRKVTSNHSTSLDGRMCWGTVYRKIAGKRRFGFGELRALVMRPQPKSFENTGSMTTEDPPITRAVAINRTVQRKERMLPTQRFESRSAGRN